MMVDTVTKSDSESNLAAARHDDNAEIVELPTGRGLSFEECDEVTLGGPTSVVVFAGTAKAGKTTLISAISLLFQKGTFAGCAFAGSNTLVGFEERNHHVVVASGKCEVKMPRSTTSEALHIRVAQLAKERAKQNLLLCDMTSEEYRYACDSVDACREIPILNRSDVLVLLVDGERLVANASRQSAKSDCVMLLRTCLDAGVLGGESRVQVLVTKWDLVEDHENQVRIIEFVDEMFLGVKEQFSERLGHLYVGKVAAQPVGGSLAMGHGLAEPFKQWLDAIVVTIPQTWEPDPSTVYESEFDNFERRYRRSVR